jgi:hypothetical protein
MVAVSFGVTAAATQATASRIAKNDERSSEGRDFAGVEVFTDQL